MLENIILIFFIFLIQDAAILQSGIFVHLFLYRSSYSCPLKLLTKFLICDLAKSGYVKTDLPFNAVLSIIKFHEFLYPDFYPSD